MCSSDLRKVKITKEGFNDSTGFKDLINSGATFKEEPPVKLQNIDKVVKEDFDEDTASMGAGATGGSFNAGGGQGAAFVLERQ